MLWVVEAPLPPLSGGKPKVSSPHAGRRARS